MKGRKRSDQGEAEAGPGPERERNRARKIAPGSPMVPAGVGNEAEMRTIYTRGENGAL